MSDSTHRSHAPQSIILSSKWITKSVSQARGVWASGMLLERVLVAMVQSKVLTSAILQKAWITLLDQIDVDDVCESILL